jgi:hypothetical protein
MKYKFRPPRASIRASIKEYPDGCCTRPYQVINLRHAYVLGYMAGQKAIRKRRAQTGGRS